MIYPVIAAQTALPFYLSGIGVSDPEYAVRRETGLVSHQFLYTQSGTGVLQVGGNSYIQKTGSIFYLAPSVAHEYYPQDSDWTTCWLVFRGNYAAQLMNGLGFKEYATAADNDLTRLDTLFQRILTTAADPLANEKTSALLYEYILEAREVLLNTGKKKNGEGSIVETAVKYINKCYSEDITLEQLAGMSGVSLQHFCRVFRAKMGMRPLEYIGSTRIAQAKLMLMNTDMSISEIGKAVGYGDQTYFGIVFKKSEGISPSRYRKLKGSAVI